MEHCTLNDANRVVDSILTAINDYQFSWEEKSFKVGASIGLVPITETTGSVTTLLQDADAACYVAKDEGRNRAHVHHQNDGELAKRHGEMQWVSRINQALENDQFVLYAQVIEPLYEDGVEHHELLLRMIDEDGSTIPPGAFLPAAERYNLISHLDRWIVDHAFQALEEHPLFLERVHSISVNLSGASLADESFLEFIQDHFAKSGFPASKICFEITETAAISNLNRAMKFISTLNALGCRFALDDFGSGLSSFAYLKNLPVDYLKIDGMFVKDIIDDPIDHAMVKSINEIGQVMGMQTIAEFVENDEIKDMLKNIGVDYAQGFGIGKPMPFEQILEP
jgi:EAL domain-containing protein (putative c-di-GMP-specific phosphodiesterase class I)